MSSLEDVVLSDYLLLECISRGREADVYRARQNDVGSYEVAVKIFRPDYAGRKAFRTYFMSEAEKIGQFEHPHILPFIEYGEGEGLLYTVTPFVKSGTLEDLLKKVGGKFSVTQALPIVQQLCDAVQYAHEHNVIHGDLKPSNVFVANDGRMLLADFSITRGYADSQQAFISAGWNLTEHATSSEYAAPEQSLGLLRRSGDIYALGALFFRLLTGSSAFVGQTPVGVLPKHMRQEPPSARALNMGISDTVDKVLRKALSKGAEGRYQSAAELSQAFATAVTLAPVAALVASSVNLATCPLVSPVPEPSASLSVSASSLVEQPAIISPAPLQFSQTTVIALPVELQQSAPQPPVLLEQHGGNGQAFTKFGAVPEPDYTPVPSMSPYWSFEPVEWSPIAQTSVGAGQAKVADYQPPKSQALFALEPQPGANQSQQISKQDGRRKPGLLLPVLIVILLLLGLLGALISSFLIPVPSSGSGVRTLSTRVVYQTRVAHW